MYLPTKKEKKSQRSFHNTGYDSHRRIASGMQWYGKKELEGCLIKGFIQKTSLHGYTLIETSRQTP